MTNVSEWDNIDAANNSSPPAGAPEGMAPSTVNDTMRAMMGALSRTFNSQGGGIVSAGTSSAYTVTTPNANADLNDIGLICFRPHTENTGASTLAVDGLTAKGIRQAGNGVDSGVLRADDIVCVVYNSDADAFDLIGGYRTGIGGGGTGSGTATGARANLGVSIGSDVQAWDTELDELAALSNANSNFIVGNGSVWVAEAGATARASMGVAIGSDVQAHDADLDAIAALAKTNNNFIVANGSAWVAENPTGARSSLGLGDLATQNTIDNSDWSGTDLAVANGGTAASNSADARTNLGLGSIATRNLTVSTAQPSGGVNGDLWFVREA